MKIPPPTVLFALVSLLIVNAYATDAQIIAGVDTSQWRGFNLLEKFTLRGNARYKEDDFKWIAELGFNIARLPIDYRCYTDASDWLKFNEAALKEIDEAIEFGARHKIHVCLNLHRAPGFCINPPAEPRDLWTDPVAQDAFVAHWVMFAERYRRVPPEQLSFNLLNEPTHNTRESYVTVNRRAIEAIHQVDPRRLIIVDGNNVGRDPTPEFVSYDNVIQATRGYHPSSVSHYKASWVKGSDKWPDPVWPPSRIAGQLYGPSKPELRSPLVLRGNFAGGTTIALKLTLLSSRAKLEARADGKTVAGKVFDPKLAPDAWRAAKSDSKWTQHEPTGEMKFEVQLDAVTRELAIENVDGDWIQFSELTLTRPDGMRHSWTADATWGTKQATHEITADGRLLPPRGRAPDQALVDYLKPWVEVASQGETVFVGEWGCFNRTPHRVALAWMKNWLEHWQRARFGWALWNFRGSFGILDSGRTDVTYEDFHGHKLDREMVALLQSYGGGAQRK